MKKFLVQNISKNFIIGMSVFLLMILSFVIGNHYNITLKGNIITKTYNKQKALTYLEKKYPEVKFNVQESNYDKEQNIYNVIVNPINEKSNKATVTICDDSLSDDYFQNKLNNMLITKVNPIISKNIKNVDLSNSTVYILDNYKLTQEDMLNLNKSFVSVRAKWNDKDININKFLEQVNVTLKEMNDQQFSSILYEFKCTGTNENITLNVFKKSKGNGSESIRITTKNNLNENEFIDLSLQLRDQIKENKGNLNISKYYFSTENGKMSLTLNKEFLDADKDTIIKNKLVEKAE